MRFKLDENTGQRAAAFLTAAGHDVSTVRDERLSGAADTVVLETPGVTTPDSIRSRLYDFLAALQASELGRELRIVEPGRIRVHERE